MTEVRQKKENVKMHLKDLRNNLKKMHLAVTEELLLPKPDEVKTLMKEKTGNYLTSGSKNISAKIKLQENPEVIIWGVVTYVIHQLQ